MHSPARLLSLPALVLLIAPLGCTTEVAGDPDPTQTAIAMLASQVPQPPGDVQWSPPDPASVVVFVGYAGATCQDPFVPAWHDGNTCAGPDRNVWQIVVAIPPAAQKAGTLSLDDPSMLCNEEMQVVQGDKCAGGGGSLTGTMDIVSFDASSVGMRFDGASTPQGTSDIGDMADAHQILSGKTVTATRCP